MSVNEKLTAIADAIREYGNLDSSLNLDQMAAAIPNVHERAYGDGSADGFAKGEEAGFAYGEVEGKKAERDAFWEMLQDGGNRTDYQHAFRAVYTDETFTPKYDITPTNANQMFIQCKITNLKALLESAKVTLDTSNARFITQMFQASTITHLPVMDCTASSLVSAVFSDMANLVYIEKLIVAEKHTFPNAFSNNKSLTEIRVEGEIANDINFQWSPLSVESMKSIISCLTNYAGTSNEFAHKITFQENCWTALEADSVAPDGTTWREYVGNTLGWNT